jgi:hypothetical protein
MYNADQIFGKFDPRQMDLNLFELFGPTRNNRKVNRYQKRGSSAVWNDDKEFLTPTPTCAGKQVTLDNNSVKVSNFEDVLHQTT